MATTDPDLNHALLRIYDVQNLLSNGFIDVKDLPIAPLLPQSQIHSVFCHTNWSGLSQEDYDLISPVLRLASRILDCPQVLPFFIGLLGRPLQSLWNADVQRRFGAIQYCFGERYYGGEDEYHDLVADAWQKMQVMKDVVTFEFGKHDTSWGLTKPVGTGPLPQTSSSRILVDSQYLQILQGTKKAQDFPTARTLKLDPAAASLRTQLHMATLLCHEFCHALDMAYNQRPPSPDQEPFYRSDRIAELGWAFQQQIFDGVIEPICGVHKDITCPYGLFNRLFPGPTTRVKNMELRSPAAAGVTRIVYAAVSMEYVKGFFTEAFWDRQVNQYGIACLRADRLGPALVGLRSEMRHRRYASEAYLGKMDQDEIDAGVVPLAP